jgi:hypothetical protein
MDRPPVGQFGLNSDDVGSHGWYTGSYGVDAAFMSFHVHGRGIHIV